MIAVETIDTNAFKKVKSRILGNIPESWIKTTLGECFKWGSGGTPKSGNSEYYGGNIPWLVIGDLNDSIINASSQKITEKGLRNSCAKLVDEGTLLLAMYGSIGKLGIAGMKLATNQAIAFAEKNEIDTKYLFNFLLYVRLQLSALGKGATQQNISQTVIKAFPFPLAPLNEQKRIVAKIEELFSELDNGVAALKTARERLKVYRQAVLKHAFEGKLTAKWREENADKLESPEQLLARIQHEREARYQEQLEDWQAAVKEWEANGKKGKKPSKPKKLIQLTLQSKTSNLKRALLPAGWSHIKLGNLIDEPVYGTSAKCDYEIGEQSVLRIPNISAGMIDDNDLKFANFEKGEIDHLRLMIGDILTIRSNGSISLVGSCGLVKEKDTKHIFAGYLIRLRPNKKMIKSEYLLAVMNSHLIRQQIESAAKSTSGVNNINSSELQNLIIPLTSIQEQEVLISSLDSILPMIKSTEIEIDKQLAKAETLRQSILKKAFSGQLVPQDPSDEPASELLARIQTEKEFINTQKNQKKNNKHSVSGH